MAPKVNAAVPVATLSGGKAAASVPAGLVRPRGRSSPADFAAAPSRDLVAEEVTEIFHKAKRAALTEQH